MSDIEDLILEDKTFEVYLSQTDIAALVSKLAAELNEEYGQYQLDVLLVSILDGSFIFMADLVRSYEDMESSGEVEFILDLNSDISDKHIVIIEDIIDTGLTIESFVDRLKAQNPLSIKTCTLLSKPEVHNDIVDIHFVGKEIPPEFVVGYGLDLNGYGRNLPHLYKLKV